MAISEPNRAPTHNLCIKKKGPDGKKFVQVGAGWQNEKGQINVVLDMGVHLSWRDLEDCYLSLFPNSPGGRAEG